MPKETNAAMTQVGDIKLPKPPKTCAKCGNKYIPTGNNQVYCQDCRHGKKANPNYIKARMASDVKIIYPANKDAGNGGNKAAIETPEEKLKQPEKPAEVTRQVIEDPEQGIWYEARITKGKTLMLDARIHPDMLAMIIKEVR